MIEQHTAVNGEKWLSVNGSWVQVTNNIKLVDEIKEANIGGKKVYVMNAYTNDRSSEPYYSVGFATPKDAMEFKENFMSLMFSDDKRVPPKKKAVKKVPVKKPATKKKPAASATIKAKSTSKKK